MINQDEVSDLLIGARRMANALSQIDESKVNDLLKKAEQAKHDLQATTHELRKSREKIAYEWDSHVKGMESANLAHKKALLIKAKEEIEARKIVNAEMASLKRRHEVLKAELIESYDSLMKARENELKQIEDKIALGMETIKFFRDRVIKFCGEMIKDA